MRFQRLHLERYGRFEECTLDFRAGTPDLHVVYGPNEAGKSTTLAAVSDLLFGFGARTPYNFLFDNALLRVGAELEEDGRKLLCRRRKGNAATLVDAADRAIDEGPLLAMLRGQTRDSFRLAFSLDQEGLRRGGRAMVEAKDDVGQALFAAGSGLTGVAGELDRLNAEADTIWGRRAKASRSYTAAERDWSEATRQVRDLALKPKAWADARAASDTAETELSALEAERDALLAEQRSVERLRRIGPALRRREEVLARLTQGVGTILLSPQREALAAVALEAAETAERERRAAAVLLAEAEARAAEVTPDAAVLAAAEAIDALADRRGGIAKAGQDRARLTIEARTKQIRIADLQRELGQGAAAAPSRLVVARLRELARKRGEATSGARALDQSIADLVAREQPLRNRLADVALSEALPTLTAAVDAARRLGGDVDERCATADRAVERAEAGYAAIAARLAPWRGTANALRGLAVLPDGEIDIAQNDQVRQVGLALEEEATIARLEEDVAALALERDALARQGGAISADAVGSARGVRDAQWRRLRDHLSGAVLPDPGIAVDAFEEAMQAADALADRRFALAEASGRLAELEARDAGLRLQAEQARQRREAANWALAEARQRWQMGLAAGGLPALDPLRLRAWAMDRAAALEADTAIANARDVADSEHRRRHEACATLQTVLPGEHSERLAPLLARAEALRQDGEARDKAFREDRAELRQIKTSLDSQRRRAEQSGADAAQAVADWQAALAESGLALAIDGAEARLAVFEELRGEVDAAAQLDTRLRGIDVDADLFAADTAALATALGAAPTSDSAAAIVDLRRRLDAARLDSVILSEIIQERDRRQREVDAATAKQGAAIASLAPALAEAQIADKADLPAAIEASRIQRQLRDELADIERQVGDGSDSYALADLVAAWEAQDPDLIATRAATLASELVERNAAISRAATARGDTRRSFAALEGRPGAAAEAAADAEQARAEMAVQAEAFLLKRAQALTLRWAMDRYRDRRQDPLLLRASRLFETLTLGRYIQLRVDLDGPVPRLSGLRDDGRTLVDIGAMSEGTTDQLFLALRLAAIEQSVAAGVRLPFLADDLFVNFDDARAEAGFRVLAELARSTQVLFLTHHPHLADIARCVVGAEFHSECTLA